MANSHQHNGKRDGFALVLAIWIFGLIAAILTGFLLKVRVENLVAANLVSNAKAEWIADGMVRKVALELSRQTAPANGIYQRCRWSDGSLVEISLQDQAGLIDLNTAPFSVLQLLLRQVGGDERLALAIGDYRDRDTTDQDGGPEPQRYDGFGHGPKNAPFDSVGESQQVPGIDANLFARLAPLLTVHSFEVGLDGAIAPQELKALITAAPDVFSTYNSRSKLFSYAISVRVQGNRNARFHRRSIAILHRQSERPFSFVAWHRANDWGDEFAPSQFTGDCLTPKS